MRATHDQQADTRREARVDSEWWVEAHRNGEGGINDATLIVMKVLRRVESSIR